VSTVEVTEQKVLDDMRRDERQRVEFKEGFIRTGQLAECVMAFANAEGGTIYLGIAGKPTPHLSGKIRQVTKEYRDNIHRAARDVLTPPVEGVTAHEVRVDDKLILAIVVPRSDSLHQHANGKFLIRRGSENVALRGDSLRQTWVEREQPSFDDRCVTEATIDDLDPERVDWYLRRAAQERGLPVDTSLPLEENLLHLGVVVQNGGQLVPRMAGLLLFGYEPQRFVPHSMVRLARFQGTSSLNFIDRVDCRGTLPEMIDEAEQFIRRNTRVAARITGFERREITEYPYLALREAVANAVAHRDYWRRDVEVRVSVFADRAEVQSPGRLPAPLTVDTLGDEYVLRNRLIAELLFNIRYIERWNTGIRRMRRWMREHGLAEPVFEEIGDTFRVTFRGPGDNILDLIPQEGITDLQALGLNERQIEALRLMVNEGQVITNRWYRQRFGVTNKAAANDLRELVESQQAIRVGRGRSTGYRAA
jgi:ATP-dependent DNA helicase RecG